MLGIWVVITLATAAAATANMSCVSDSVCLNVSTSRNSTAAACPVDLVDCLQVDPCLRTTEFWSSHMSEWPIANGAFCFHTWQDILLQDPVSQHGNIFPTDCHALAVIAITLVLNDQVGAIRSSSAVLTILDAALLEVADCCADPIHSDTNSIHHLFSYLSGLYNMNDQNSSTDLMPFCSGPASEPSFFTTFFATLTVTQLAVMGCLVASILLITFFSVSTCVHYNILCRVWNHPETVTKEYRDRAYYMILSEKFSLYSIVDIGTSADYIDEYSTEELENSQFASTLNEQDGETLDQTIVQIHKAQQQQQQRHRKGHKNIIYF